MVPSGARRLTSNCDSSFFGKKSFPPKMKSGTTESKVATLASTTTQRCAIDQREHARVGRPRSSRRSRESSRRRGAPCGRLESQRLASIGVSVKLTSMLTRIVTAIVTPNDFRNRPTMPPIKAIGRNTATSDRVIAITARPISRVAAIAACIGGNPFSSMKRKMFSITTMASSITMPTDSVSASKRDAVEREAHAPT